jgi:hypothetical protein
VTDISIERPKKGPLTLMLAPKGGDAATVYGIFLASWVGAGGAGGVRMRASYAAKSVMAAAPCVRGALSQSGLGSSLGLSASVWYDDGMVDTSYRWKKEADSRGETSRKIT